jgi:hypothetical protein
MTLISTDPVSNTEELHCRLTKDTSKTCISYIYLSWIILVFSFFCHILLQLYFQFLLLTEESLQHHSSASFTSIMSWAFQSSTGTLWIYTLRLIHYHRMISILLDSTLTILKYSKRLTHTLPHPIHDYFMVKLL